MYKTYVYSLKQLMCQPIAKETLRTTCVLYGMLWRIKRPTRRWSPLSSCAYSYITGWAPKNVSHIDVWPYTPFSLAWKQTRITLGGGSLCYWKDWGTVQTVLLGGVRSHVLARPAGRASVISGELQAGGNSTCLCLTGVLLWPPEAHPGQHAYTFGIRILSTTLSSFSIFSLCCCSMYLSLWCLLCAVHWTQTIYLYIDDNAYK